MMQHATDAFVLTMMMAQCWGGSKALEGAVVRFAELLSAGSLMALGSWDDWQQ